MKKFKLIFLTIIAIILFSPYFNLNAESYETIEVGDTKIPISYSKNGNILIDANYATADNIGEIVDKSSEKFKKRSDNLILLYRDDILFVASPKYYFTGTDRINGRKYFQHEYFLYHQKWNQIMYCVEPEQFKVGNGENNIINRFDNDIELKNKISTISQISSKLSLEKGTLDYAIAGQSLIHELLMNDYTVTRGNDLLNQYKEEIKTEINNFTKTPSFAGKELNLSYNYETEEFEGTFYDENQVLDKYYNKINNLNINDINFSIDNNSLTIKTKKVIQEPLAIDENLVGEAVKHNNGDITEINLTSSTYQDLVGILKNEIKYDFKIKTPLGRITGIKTDEFGNYLENAQFSLYFDKNKNQIIDQEDLLLNTIKSDALGNVVFENIPLGSYIVKETLAPQGYEINETLFPLEITVDSLDQNILGGENIINNSKRGGFLIIKKDEANNLIEGVDFEIYKDVNANDTIDTEDILLDTKVTNNEGKIQYENLPLGQYLIKETKTLDNLELNDNINKIIIDDNNYQTIQVIEVINMFKKGSIKIHKIDNFNNNLANAKFNLYKDTNKDNQIDEKDELIVEEAISNENGEIIFDSLMLDTYLIKEIEAPEGYTLSEEIKSIEINPDNYKDENKITFINEKIPLLEENSTSSEENTIIPKNLKIHTADFFNFINIIGFIIIIYLSYLIVKKLKS